MMRPEADDPDFALAVQDFARVVEKLALAGPEVAPPPAVRAKLLAALTPRRPGPLFSFARDAKWKAYRPGIEVRRLRHDRTAKRVTILLRLDAGAELPPHSHDDYEECLVLEGELQVGDVVLRPGDYQSAERDSRHVKQFARTPALVLITAAADQPLD